MALTPPDTTTGRHELVVALAGIERALADRLVIVREVIAADGTIVATIRRNVPLPKERKHEHGTLRRITR